MENFDGQIIKLTKWEKYNLRKDVKQHSWFRLQNDIFGDHEFFDFTHSEMLFWIYLLSLASKKQDAHIRFSQTHAERIGRFQPTEIASALQKLEEIGALRVTLPARTDDFTDDFSGTLRTRTDDFSGTLRTRTDDFLPDENSRDRHIHTDKQTDRQTDRTEKENLSQKSLNPEEVKQAIEEWGKTLGRYKIEKDPSLDEVSITRLIQIHGFEKAKLALLGAGFEERSQDYDPSKHVNIRRLLKPDIFEKFVNLGAQNKPTERKCHEIEIVC